MSGSLEGRKDIVLNYLHYQSTLLHDTLQIFKFNPVSKLQKTNRKFLESLSVTQDSLSVTCDTNTYCSPTTKTTLLGEGTVQPGEKRLLSSGVVT